MGAIETVFTILIVLGIGYLISYLDWYKEENKSFLSNLILKVSIPCIVVKNILIDFTREELFDSSGLIIISFLGMLFILIISSLLGRIFKMDANRKSSFVSSASLGNLMFIGLPVIGNLFGEEGIPYLMIFYLISTIFLWLVFVPMFKEKEEEDSLRGRLESLLSIPLITLLISMILLLLGVSLPEILIRPISMVGSMGTPLALIFIGGVIYEVGFKNIKIQRDTILVILLKFIIFPSIMFALAVALGMNNLQIQVFTIIGGMPTMTQIGVIADEYSQDSEFVMTNIVVTTLLSLAFIPLTMLILETLLI